MTPVLDRLSFRRRTVAWAAGALVVLSSLSAGAKPEFPAIVQEVTFSPCEPPCSLCHDSNAPSGPPIAGTPFFFALAAHFGFAPPSTEPGILRDALFAFRRTTLNPDGTCDLDADANGICDLDANQNGINDSDDLEAGLNPNTNEDLCDLPAYGCGASRIEPKGDVKDYGLFLGVFAAMTLLFKVRRRRQR